MYFNGTKCQLLILSCFMSASLLAKDVKTLQHRSLDKPLCFVENKGQVMDGNNHFRSDVQFKLAAKGLNLFVGNAQLHYQFRKVEDRNNQPFITSYPMDVTLVGANTHAALSVDKELSYYENYFLAQTGKEGFTAHAYGKVTYKDVYPNIDWVLYVNNGEVEYDFVVREGGNPADIKIKYSGSTSLALAKDGGIVAKTPMGEVAEKQPYAFETATGKKVNAHFAIHDNVVSFETGSYNGSLTIDPYLNFCTYLGGGNDDMIAAVKVAPNSPYNIFVCGKTSSNAGFTTGGVYQTTYGAGTYDAFVARYSAAGALSFVTYYGGAGTDDAVGIVTSASGNTIYIVGNTTTNAGAGIATLNTYRGAGDIYIASLNNTGTTRNWGRYVGGPALDVASSIAIDAGGNIFVGGSTQSTSSISTNGTTLTGAQDGYLGKFNNAGTVQWATYYGGSIDDEVDAIAVDGSNNVVAAGTTTSVSGMTTTGAAQVILGSGSASDGFLAKFAGTTGNRIFGTYVGGANADRCLGVSVDAGNNIYVTGITSSTDSITAGIAYQSSIGGGSDAFVQKYTTSGTELWGTYLGGNSNEQANGIATDAYGNVVVTGYTFSTSGFSTPAAYQASFGGGGDAFVSKFTPAGQDLYTTYFGNSATDLAYGISTDPSNTSVVIAGSSTNGTGFTSAGAAQGSFGGGAHDGFVARFLQDTIVLLRQSAFTDTLICSTGTLTVYDTTLTNFQAGNTFSVQLSDASGSFASPTVIGTSSSTATGAITCNLTGVTPGTGYRIRIVASNPAFTSPDNNIDIHIVNSLPAATVTGTPLVCVGQTISLGITAPYIVTAYNWSGPSSFSSAAQNAVVTTSAVTANAGTYTVTTSHNGCPDVNNTFAVAVNSFIPPAADDSTNSPVCLGSPIRLYATPTMAGTFSYYWTGPGGFTSTLQNPVISAASGASAGMYYVIDTLNMCPSALSAGVLVTVLPLDTPNITIAVSPNDTVCLGTSVNFTSTNTHGGYSPTYQWLSGPTTPIVGAIYSNYSTAYFSLGTAIRCVMTSNIGCPDKPTDTSNIIYMQLVDNTPVVTITATPDTFVSFGSNVTFHAIIAGYSLLPGQWYVNNTPVADTTTTLVLNHITHSDTVRYEVPSTMICASIGVSNTVIVRLNTAVGNVSSSEMNIDMLPNPNSGSFSLKGLVDGMDAGTLSLTVTNAVGQVVYTGTTAVKNNMVDASISMKNVTPGMYLLRVSKEGSTKVFRFIVD